MSKAFVQSRAIAAAPQIPTPRTNKFQAIPKLKVAITLNPKVPSFSKMAAKIMDPNTGASTCALGSHLWTK